MVGFVAAALVAVGTTPLITAVFSVACMKQLPGKWVAWDGIEPPTQGFSILCSTD